jgi:hypothetical protein
LISRFRPEFSVSVTCIVKPSSSGIRRRLTDRVEPAGLVVPEVAFSGCPPGAFPRRTRNRGTPERQYKSKEFW